MRRSSLLLACLLSLATWAASPDALALSPEAAKAEHTRLSEEMRKLAKRNAWHGVEKQYRGMLDLVRDGVVLSYDDHMLGAEAARQLGRITSVYNRLLRAEKLDANDEVLSWLKDIRANYGAVLLVRDDRYKGDASLRPKVPPFDPSKRAAIGAAQQTLEAGTRFEGLLPHGEYTFGEQPFTVAADAASRPEIVLAPEGANRDRLAKAPSRSGLRLSVGPGLAQIGGYAGGGATGLEPTDSRGGLLVRGGLGYSIAFGESKAGLLIEAGYHGMLPKDLAEDVSGAVGGAWSSQPVLGDASSSMTLGFGQIGPTVWLGGMELSLAAAFAGGKVATVSGALCDSGDECNGVVTTGTATPVSPAEATLLAPGVTLGAAWIPRGTQFGLGRGTYGVGLGLQAGTWADSARMYPWAQVALSLLPSAHSK